MHWIIQSDLVRERALVDLLNLLARYGIRHDTVAMIPNGGGIAPDLAVNAPVVVVGSVALARRAVRAGWRPGAWLGRSSEHDFSYDRCIAAYGRAMLNADALVVPFADLLDHDLERFFVRPLADGKLFTGTVLARTEAATWRTRIQGSGGTRAIAPETSIIVSSVKPILSETRFVVVDGQVVTGSVYRRGRTVLFGPEVEPHILAYARAMVARWTPDRVCVVDIADTPDGPKIIEFNTFNAAAWYACDVSKIVQAIETMPE